MIRARFADAILQEAIWKSAEIQRYAVALVLRAVRLYERGTRYFGSDDVDEEDQPRGHGIAGSVCEMLKRAHVIEHYYGSKPEDGVFAGRRRSKRESRNGAKIDLYSLCSLKAAETFLARHGVKVAKQIEMELGVR